MRGLVLAATLCGVAAPAAAELALLDNGQVLKVESWREEGGLLVLRLGGGGEVGVAPDRLRAILPDEISDEPLPLASAPPPPSPGADAPSGLKGLAASIAESRGVDPELVLAVIAVESAFRPTAVSPKGAQGLMQLMPATAEELGVQDVFDPEQNVDAGVRHLRDLLRRYQGDLSRALAAYNAGAASVDRHDGIPPWPETRDYVAAVMRRYRPGGGE